MMIIGFHPTSRTTTALAIQKLFPPHIPGFIFYVVDFQTALVTLKTVVLV